MCWDGVVEWDVKFGTGGGIATETHSSREESLHPQGSLLVALVLPAEAGARGTVRVVAELELHHELPLLEAMLLGPAALATIVKITVIRLVARAQC